MFGKEKSKALFRAWFRSLSSTTKFLVTAHKEALTMKYFALLAAVAITTTTACAGPNSPAPTDKSTETSIATVSANQKAPVKYRFKEIEVDGNYCVAHVFGGQYSNGQPYRHAFVPSAEVCEKVTEPGFRAGVAASATQGVTTYDSEKK